MSGHPTSSVFLGSLDSKFKESIERSKGSHRDESDDDEILFAELEAEIENAESEAVRDRGLKEMKAQLEKVQNMQQTGHGRYTEIENEKEVIRTSAKEPRCVIHFYHRDFKRCQIMDKHLAALAQKYFSTLFIRVFVENVPWLIERLGIKVLPCVVCFVNGVSRDTIVGFEQLGNTDAFETATLELRLQTKGVLVTAEKNNSTTYTTSTTRTRMRLRGQADDDSDLDL